MLDYDTALLNFLATFAGVGLAFFLTLRYDRWKKHNDEKEARERMLSSIQKELHTNHDFLKELDARENYPGANMFLWTEAYQSTVNGGDIQLFDPTLQTRLAMIYLDFKQIDRYGQKLLEMFGKGFDKPYSDILELMKNTVKTTLLHLPKALEIVDVELRKLAITSLWRFPVRRQDSIASSSSRKVMDKDTERMKVEVVANYYTTGHVSMIIMYATVLAAFLIGYYAAYVQKQIDFTTYVIGDFVSFGGLTYYIYRRYRRFKVEVQYIDRLVEKLDSNESVGTLEEIFKKAP